MGRKVVFVPGLFGGLSLEMLRDLQRRFENAQVLSVTPGSLSSVHDRAVEIFYQLIGGRVDYGLQHSQLHKHNRYGEHYDGILEEWDADHPIDLVCYSFGAPTARYLQYLLISQAFDNEAGEKIPTNGNWIRSITTLMGTNNGSPLVHVLGLSFNTLEPVKFTILWGIYLFFYFGHWLFGPKFEWLLPLNLGHWKCSWREKSFSEALKVMSNSSENAGKDLSPKRMLDLNKEMATKLPHPNTFYLACVATTTTSPRWPIGDSQLFTCHIPNLHLVSKFPESTLMILCSTLIGLFGALVHRFTDDPSLLDPNLSAEELRHHQICNDGMVNLLGQKPPHFERTASNEFFVSLDDFPKTVNLGAWYHLLITNWSHHDVMKKGERQMAFLEQLLRFLHERLD
jgi:hypothetical protein